jgi:hypothetical protein
MNEYNNEESPYLSILWNNIKQVGNIVPTNIFNKSNQYNEGVYINIDSEDDELLHQKEPDYTGDEEGNEEETILLIPNRELRINNNKTFTIGQIKIMKNKSYYEGLGTGLIIGFIFMLLIATIFIIILAKR